MVTRKKACFILLYEDSLSQAPQETQLVTIDMACCGSDLVDMVSAARHTKAFTGNLSLSAGSDAAGIIIYYLDYRL